MITVADGALLLGAGVLAGVVGTAGGITSLISYPALLAAGVAPLPANVANIVALVACWPGAALASRPELKGRAGWVARWSVLTAVAGLAGAALLLSTPTTVFGRVVPFLVAAGALALLLQPKLSARRRPDRAHGSPMLLAGGVFLVSVYNGYFGAGAGVMTLALVLDTVDEHMARANALKNMLMGAATAGSAALLVVFAHVEWAAVVPLAVGLFAGSTIGPLVARRIPGTVLRWVVAFIGFALAVKLWLSPS